MIRYALACDQGHSFESWFQNSAAYDKQVKRGLVTCPACGSPKIEKALMAPRLSGVKKRRSSPPQESTGSARRFRAAAGGARTGRHDVSAGTRVPDQAQRVARPPHQECRLCRAEVSRGSAQDALWRDRPPLNLRRGLARSGQGTARGRDRVSPAAGGARGDLSHGRAVAGRTRGPADGWCAPFEARSSSSWRRWPTPICEHCSTATPTESAPPAALDAIVARAAGNPFFAEELLAASGNRGKRCRVACGTCCCAASPSSTGPPATCFGCSRRREVRSATRCCGRSPDCR